MTEQKIEKQQEEVDFGAMSKEYRENVQTAQRRRDLEVFARGFGLGKIFQNHSLSGPDIERLFDTENKV